MNIADVKVCVLDMDSTLLCTMGEKKSDYHKAYNDYPHLRSRLFGFDSEGAGYLWGLTRPHLEKFMKHCYMRFDYVVIWSAGTGPYVHAVINEVIKPMGLPVLIWARDECLSMDYYSSSVYTKPLRNLERLFSVSYKNMLLIDDRDYSHCFNNDRGVLIPEYAPPNDKLDVDDSCLYQLIEWFNNPCCDHKHIFAERWVTVSGPAKH
jgi:hypothetical protein